MRNLFVATLAALLLASTDSWAEVLQPLTRTLPHQEQCAVPLPADFWDDPAAKPFKTAEAWAWNERICLGQWADMRDAPGGSGNGEECRPAELDKKEAAVPAPWELRPVLLELILSHEPWVSAPRHPKVLIRCALVRGDIDLDDHEIAPSFGFDQGTIDGEVRLLGTKLKRSLSLQGSTVTGKLRADRLEVGGRLLLRDGGTFAGIDLRRARIARNAAFNGSTVTGKLNADRLEVGGSLFLHDGGTFAGIDLIGAKIAGDAAFVGSTVTGLLTADGLEVGGSLLLRDGGTFAGIRLLSARIAGNAELSGSTVTGMLNAVALEVGAHLLLLDGGMFADIDLLGASVAGDMELSGSTVAGKLTAVGLEVGGNLFLDDGGTFAHIDLLGAEIGGDVYLSGGVFGGEFDFTGTAIGGELSLSSGWWEHPPAWQTGASLILRNAKTDVLQAREDSWNVSGGDRFLQTDLTGFTFNRLGRLDPSDSVSMGDTSADWLIGWIEAQHDYGKTYDPQPYTQLAEVLDAGGATEKAKAIRYAKFEHKHKTDTSMSGFRRLLLTLEKYFVGYGLYPFRTLYWFIGFVVLGGLLVQCSNQSAVRGWMGLWYSLENTLPLIETNERFKHVAHGRPWLDHFFHFQKAFGFVLVTVLVGALTLLSG